MANVWVPFQEFSDRLVHDHAGPLTLRDRPYLIDVHRAMAARRRVVLACGRQVEKTTTLLKFALYLCLLFPGTRILWTMARFEQIRRMVRSRLMPMLHHSPMLRKVLMGTGSRPREKHLLFANGSQIFLESVGQGADAVRGLSADVWIADEVQDYGADAIPVAEECLSHAGHPRTILAGTSKLADNPLEVAYQRSTQLGWILLCAACGREVPCDGNAMGATGLACPGCHAALAPSAGRWAAGNAGADYAEGFRISQLMCPAMSYESLIEKKNGYDEFVFRNEVLGLPVNLGELVFDLNALYALCTADRKMAKQLADIPHHLRERLVAGIDYGSTSRATTVLCVGALDDTYTFHTFRFHRIPAGRDAIGILQECRDLCTLLDVRLIGADGVGHGSVLNRMLLSKMDSSHPPRLVSVEYHAGTRWNIDWQSGFFGTLHLSKTQAISGVLSRVKDRRISFPQKDQSEPFLAEIASERCEFDEETRHVRYTKSPTGPDDSLHALVAAVSVAQYAYGGQATY